MVSKIFIVSIFYIFLGKVNLSFTISAEEFTRLAPAQKIKLDQLREKVENELITNYTKQDQFLVRWLRETDFNVQLSERMLKGHLKWRKENKIDNILQEDFSDIDREYGAFLEGCGKDGNPILVFKFGEWDIRKIVVSGQTDKLIRYIYYFTEETIENMLKLQAKGVFMTHFNIIIDFDKISIHIHACPACIQFYIRAILGFQTHYPGYLNKAVIINLPQFLIPAWNAIRQVVSPKFRDLVEMFGKNKDEWERYLVKFADRSSLSKKYGGLRESSIPTTLLRKAIKESNLLYSCSLLYSDLKEFEQDQYNELNE